jgi:hypothetical protein
MNAVLLAARAVVNELGGVKVVAAALGKSPTTLAHELDPNYPSAKLGIDCAIAIDRLHGEGRIAQAVATTVGGVFMPLPQGNQADSDTGRCVVKVMKETAEAIQAAADNLAKNRGENGVAVVHKEALEAINALVSMMVCASRDAERTAPHLHAVAA